MLEASLTVIDSLVGLDAVVCLVPSDERPFGGAAGFLDWRLCGALSRAVASGFFLADPGERLLLPSAGLLDAPLVFAVGLGPSKQVTTLGFEHALSAAVTMLTRATRTNVAVALPTLPHLQPAIVDELVKRALVTPWTTGRLVLIADKAPRAA
jgi:hypothetical protein